MFKKVNTDKVILMPNDFTKSVIKKLNKGYYKKNMSEMGPDINTILTYFRKGIISDDIFEKYMEASDKFIRKLIK